METFSGSKEITSTKTITLLRHAKSDWGNSQLNDHDRPLNARGRRSAPLIGRYMAENQIASEVILASTALRAQQTLDLVVTQWTSRTPEIYCSQNLYLASPKAILSEVSKLSDNWNSVLIVGHNPGMGELASILCGENLVFPTACLASFELNVEKWQHLSLDLVGTGKKKHYCRPRELE
ncbi:MAG: histidine phosphatase family protein [Pirellulales bacterium]